MLFKDERACRELRDHRHDNEKVTFFLHNLKKALVKTFSSTRCNYVILCETLCTNHNGSSHYLSSIILPGFMVKAPLEVMIYIDKNYFEIATLLYVCYLMNSLLQVTIDIGVVCFLWLVWLWSSASLSTTSFPPFSLVYNCARWNLIFLL